MDVMGLMLLLSGWKTALISGGGCGCNLTFDIDDDKNVTSDTTAQRLDNALPHSIDNIIPMCIHCNVANK